MPITIIFGQSLNDLLDRDIYTEMSRREYVNANIFAIGLTGNVSHETGFDPKRTRRAILQSLLEDIASKYTSDSEIFLEAVGNSVTVTVTIPESYTRELLPSEVSRCDPFGDIDEHYTPRWQARYSVHMKTLVSLRGYSFTEPFASMTERYLRHHQVIQSLLNQLSSEGRNHFVEYALHILGESEQSFPAYLGSQGCSAADAAIAALIQQAMDGIKA
jgi:hypothetical protein